MTTTWKCSCPEGFTDPECVIHAPTDEAAKTSPRPWWIDGKVLRDRNNHVVLIDTNRHISPANLNLIVAAVNKL